MALQEKYAELIQQAKTGGITNLQVREQDNVLYIDGSTSSGELKDKLWDTYNKIDPDYRAGDLVLNIDATAAPGTKAKVTTESSNLNIRKGPGTDQQVLGKAAHNEEVTVLSRPNEQWSLVRTAHGVEGYAYSQYLTQV
ncbi:SH3 domain-containing protein [Mucilaginibacter terrenus]|uniref:SH3 domain-containing protein n=1 Tax=Mucilaginibacter terrenus TaxID=2482727 RepID=A0A3E2NWR0_9SPHI|nr:SH3 domain-containing protein [Mucilaginibacter terrenus]RFZ85399.1 SH3 domain-containing protein [Mucilaginibacter terrenus]